MGVPFDGAVTNSTWERFGPQEIRRASLMLCDGLHPHFELSPLEHLGDAGDMTLPNASPLSVVRQAIERAARVLMAQHHCVFKVVTTPLPPLLRAASAQHGRLALVAL